METPCTSEMRHVFRVVIGLLFLANLLFVGGADGAESADPSKPSFIVSLQQQTLRENEPLPLVFSLSNDSTQKLTGLQLKIYGPGFLHWRNGDCSQPPMTQPLALGDLSAQTALPPHVLCATAGSTSQVGTYNLFFTLQYQWTEGGVVHHSLVTAEKTVTVDVLGTSSVLGVPLAFASFVVPGVFFWLVLGIFKVPWATGRATDEKLALSILVSLFCIGLALLIRRWSFGLAWAKYFDFNSDVSFAKLGVLGGTGLTLGGLVVLVYASYQFIARRRKRELLITPEDNEFDVVRKILKWNPKYEGASVMVRLPDKTEYLGAHWAKTDDGVFLVGGFGIVKQKLKEDMQEALRKHSDGQGKLVQKEKHLSQVLELLREEYRESVEIRSPVKQYVEDKWQDIPGGYGYFKLPKSKDALIVGNRDEDLKLLELA